jgi:16S rRNA (guanine527-N7)-methyltransferase
MKRRRPITLRRATACHLTDAAHALFGDRLPLAVRYAELLVTEGVTRGLIGPHEPARIWDRHLLNCAAAVELIPHGAYVIDVGSGAGLPGIVLSVARPDLTVVLVEPLARRTAFLAEVVAELGLDRVSVMRARAEDCVDHVGPADIVIARAVAPLDRLAAWCLPLAAVGGRMLAMKGASAEAEAAQHAPLIGRLGGAGPLVRICGRELLDPPTVVVEVERRSTRIARDPGRKARRRNPASAAGTGGRATKEIRVRGERGLGRGSARGS